MKKKGLKTHSRQSFVFHDHEAEDGHLENGWRTDISPEPDAHHIRISNVQDRI